MFLYHYLVKKTVNQTNITLRRALYGQLKMSFLIEIQWVFESVKVNLSICGNCLLR